MTAVSARPLETCLDELALGDGALLEARLVERDELVEAVADRPRAGERVAGKHGFVERALHLDEPLLQHVGDLRLGDGDDELRHLAPAVAACRRARSGG